MQKTVLNVKEIADRWGLKEETIYKYISTGKLPRIKSFKGAVLVNYQEVLKFEETKDENPLSPWERKKLEKIIENLKNENEKLVKILSNITIEASKFIGGIANDKADTKKA